MKRFLLILVSLIMCLSLFSCGNEEEAPDGMKLASNTDIVDYKLFVPEGWTVSNADRGATQAFVSEGDRTNVLVMQWNITENTKTVDEWWEKEYKPQVFETGAIQDYKVLTEGKGTTLDKKEAKSYTYTGRIGDSFFKYDVVACVAQGSIYVVQFTYMQDVVEEGKEPTYSAQEKHKDAVKSIIDNFKFN